MVIVEIADRHAQAKGEDNKQDELYARRVKSLRVH
jgi:hypothetical protein